MCNRCAPVRVRGQLGLVRTFPASGRSPRQNNAQRAQRASSAMHALIYLEGQLTLVARGLTPSII